MKIVIINGPNLGRLGQRLPDVYGSTAMSEVLARLQATHPGCEFILFQSNSEGEIIDCIERYGYDADVKGVVINPGAYTHYSYAIADAIEAADRPFVEVHISNIYAREEFRSRSVTARCCKGVISGFGTGGYMMAVNSLLS